MDHTENSGRERILARIHSGLRMPAPKHSAAPTAQMVFAAIPDPLARFQDECAYNATECVLMRDSRASSRALADALAPVPEGEIYIQDAPALRRLTEGSGIDRAVRWSTEGPPTEASQATVTLAECLVAATGSILISSAAAGRGASIVAPVHIVVAEIAQLVPDLASAVEHVRKSGGVTGSSCLCLITGSSRTADIEKILVLGAHGPRRVVVILARQLD